MNKIKKDFDLIQNIELLDRTCIFIICILSKDDLLIHILTRESYQILLLIKLYTHIVLLKSTLYTYCSFITYIPKVY